MNLGSLNVAIGVDVEPLKRGMTTAKQAVLSLADQAKISERHLAALTREMDKEAQAAQRGASATKQAAALDRELRAAKSQLTAVMTGESAAAQDVARKYDLLTAAQRRQLVGVKEQITAQRALQEAELQTAVAAERAAQRQAAAARAPRRPSLQQVGQGVADIGMGLTAGVTAPILAGAAGVLAAGTQLDQAFDKIRLGTGASGQQLAALEGIAKRVGVTVPNSFAEVGQAVSELAQRPGLTGQPLEDLTRQMLTLNRLVGGDLTETIRQSARVFGDWGIAAQDQGAALDLLFRASQQTGTSVAQLSEQMTQSGAYLRQLGFSFGEAAALIGKFEKEGVNSKLVLNSLRIELGRLAKAGITDTRQAFLQIIESIKGAGSASQATAMALKVFGARAGPDMAAAIREGRFEVDKLWQSIEGGHDGILKAAKDTDDFAEKFGVLRNKVLLALQPLGSQLMKVLGQMADALIKAAPHLTRLVEGFNKLPGGAQLAVGGLLVFMAGLGPVLVGIGRFIVAWPAMVAGFGAIRTAILAVNFAALLNPITLVITALVALAAAFYTNFGGIRDYFVTGVRVMIGMLKGLSLAEAEQAAVEASRPNAQRGEIQIGENRGSLNRVKAAQEAAAGRAAAIKAAAARAAAARAGSGGFDFGQLDTGKKKQTDAERELEQVQERLMRNSRVAALLARGESVEVAKLAGQYTHLTVEQLRGVIASEKATNAAIERVESTKKFTADMAKLNAEIRRLKQGHDAEASGVDALKEKYPGLSSAMLGVMNNAIQWKKHLAEVNTEARRVADAIRQVSMRAIESTAATRAGAEAVKLFGEQMQRKFPGINSAQDVWRNLTPGQQRQAKGVATTGGETDLRNELNRLTQENRVLAYRSPTNQISQQFLGQSAEQLSAKQLEMVQRTEDARNANQQLAASQQLLAGQQQNLNAIIGTASINLGNLQEKTEILSHGTRDERDAFLQLGVSLQSLPKDVQEIEKATFALDRRFSESQAFIQQFAQGTEQIFQGMFKGLMEHGFKGFFQNVKQGFTQLFQDIAAQYLAAKLTDLILGAPDSAGARSGGVLKKIFGMASGGQVQAAHRYMVGERGPEMFVPASNGRIVPNSQLAGAGGGNVTINLNVSTPDVQGFRANSKALVQDAYRAGITAQRRNG